MSNRTMYPAQSYGSSRVYAEFVFTAPGAATSVVVTGASSVLTGADIVASIAHVAGTNVLTVTLKDTFNKIVDAQANVRDDAGAGTWCSIGTITNEGTATPSTFKIQYFDNLGAAANNSVLVTSVTLVLRNGNWGTK